MTDTTIRQKMIELVHQKKILVFGCGNPLFGDDGFGPAVIEQLHRKTDLPDHVACMDMGTSVREMLFDILLSETKPACIIIVDSAAPGFAPPGSIREISLDEINPKKTGNFSLHQFPTTNLLRELHQETGMDVRVLVAGINELPRTVRPGLSDAVETAIPEMCHRIITLLDSYPIQHAPATQGRMDSINGIGFTSVAIESLGMDYD